MAILAGTSAGCVAHLFDRQPTSAESRPATEPPGPPGEDPAVRPAAGQSRPDLAASLPQPSPGVSPRAADTPASIPSAGEPYPIDLPAALRLADAENPTIAEARVGILDALAQQLAARTLLLPSLNGGATYHGHAGDVQRSSGRILNVSNQSLYLGGGAGVLGTQTVTIPAVSLFSPLTDAIYEPLAAKRRVAGARFEASATANTVLLEVATLYLELQGAEAAIQARRATAAEADDIARITLDFAIQGESRPADANRADIERRLIQAELQRGEEAVAVASARLSRRLNLDPSVRLRTSDLPLAPICLVEPSQPVEALIQVALERRPDLGARVQAIEFALARLREEVARPLLPTISLGFSGGVFGGGSNLVPPDLGHFGGRTDFDVRAYWTLLNFGAGNASLQKRRRGEVGEAQAERARTINTVRAQVVSARGESRARAGMVETARAAVATSEAGYRQDRAQLRESLIRTIEAVNSLRLLNQARLALIDAIVRHNQAQFALFVALGSPPPAPPSPMPVAPPMATPLNSPIVSRRETVPIPRP